MGLGRNSVSSRRRVPSPPHKITTFTLVSLLNSSWASGFIVQQVHYSGDASYG
jgi:hypothetical protein